MMFHMEICENIYGNTCRKKSHSMTSSKIFLLLVQQRCVCVKQSVFARHLTTSGGLCKDLLQGLLLTTTVYWRWLQNVHKSFPPSDAQRFHVRHVAEISAADLLFSWSRTKLYSLATLCSKTDLSHLSLAIGI